MTGQCAAVNIIKKSVSKELEAAGIIERVLPSQAKLPPFPPMMALAVGDEAVTQDPNGKAVSGREVKKMHFGEDLGLSSKSFDLIMI